MRTDFLIDEHTIRTKPIGNIHDCPVATIVKRGLLLHLRDTVVLGWKPVIEIAQREFVFLQGAGPYELLQELRKTAPPFVVTLDLPEEWLTPATKLRMGQPIGIMDRIRQVLPVC